MENMIKRIEEHLGFKVRKHMWNSVKQWHNVTIEIPKGQSFVHPCMDGMDVYAITNIDGDQLIFLTLDSKIINK